MSYRINISDEAFQSVETFLDYIALEKQAPINAGRWWKKAYHRIRTLREFPYRCPLAPENELRDYEIRMLIVDKCLFLYTVKETEKIVRIFNFRHSSQNIRPNDLPGNI